MKQSPSLHSYEWDRVVGLMSVKKIKQFHHVVYLHIMLLFIALFSDSVIHLHCRVHCMYYAVLIAFVFHFEFCNLS